MILLLFLRIVILLQLYRKWQILFTVVYMLCILGKICTVILLLQPVLFYFARYLSKKRVCIWLCSIVSLTAINVYKKNEEIQSYCSLNEFELYTVSVSLCWMNLKCTSFYLEQSLVVDGVAFFSYCLYPPTMFTGPFILYEDIVHTYKLPQRMLSERIILFAKNVLKCMFWFLFGNVCLHFIYVSASTFHPTVSEIALNVFYTFTIVTKYKVIVLTI